MPVPMSDLHGVDTPSGGETTRPPWDGVVIGVTLSLLVTVVAVMVWVGVTTHPTSSLTTGPASALAAYPVGVPDRAEPSGLAPLRHNNLHGFQLTNVVDFSGRSLPTSWVAFAGQPGGLAGGHFSPSHATVSQGALRLVASPDPLFGGHWATGGVCQCGRSATYGAYFVRSRVTGVGPNEVELLWPANNVWPPEIDFSETGQSVQGISATVHSGRANTISQLTYSTNMLRWHTWGVIWTPRSITYVVDGHPWGVVTQASMIPSVPMRLDLEQRFVCGANASCPKHSITMLVDWVMEYRYTGR